jgi:hypothetical protein
MFEVLETEMTTFPIHMMESAVFQIDHRRENKNNEQ